eukprot:PITA_23207
MNLALKDIVKEELQKLLDAGFIYPISDSEWVSPLVLVPKKNGKWRICVDYRELNKAAKKDHFTLPFIDQVLDGLEGKTFFSFLDGFSREEEVFDILLTYHDGPCGGHFVAKRTAFKILQASYYWPTLHQDVRRYTSKYDQCQRMGKHTPKDEMPMQPQVTFEPFEKWGVDFVGPINSPLKKKKYIIVCTDYLKKWAETKAIKAVTEEKVAEFLRENIFYKFRYARELVTDQGIQFTSSPIEDLLTHHKIKHNTSTPYHPQANGQVEVTNRALEGILTKVVRSSRKEWANRLFEATWAYNTTWKTNIGFTPYELVYGKKALLSIQF